MRPPANMNNGVLRMKKQIQTNKVRIFNYLLLPSRISATTTLNQTNRIIRTHHKIRLFASHQYVAWLHRVLVRIVHDDDATSRHPR
jgi:hypothetical protein